MTYSSFTNYQQSDEDYAADFDYNDDQFVDKDDIFIDINNTGGKY